MRIDKDRIHHWRRFSKEGDTVLLDIRTTGLSERMLLSLSKIKLQAYLRSCDQSESTPLVFPDEKIQISLQANVGCRIHIGQTRIQYSEYGDRASTESRRDDFVILYTLFQNPHFTLTNWTLSSLHADSDQRIEISQGSDKESLLTFLAAP